MAVEDIYNWYQINDYITTSGQFTEKQFSDLVALGVKYIINLGLHNHEYALPDEASLVAQYGLEYIYLPVDFNNPTHKDFEKFCAIMEKTENEKIHIHCIANYRVSAFIYLYYRDVKKQNAEQAKTDMLSIWQPNDIWAKFIA